MRIETLEVSGLRSHRGNPPTSLVLTGKRLVAVVGHTGAGKSSLLEAITFALFGEATYGGRAYEELSSDGRSEMTVKLAFTCGDERFQLLRTVAPDRNGKFSNKVVYLRKVGEDGTILSHTEGVREIDRMVTALLGGMTREQFCQAVLLAQNRFAALLEANPADRDRLLDTLLGLNALSDARTALQKTRNAVGRNIDRLGDRRSLLPTDPASEARAAATRASTMNDIAKEAEECGSNLDCLAEQATALSQQATDLDRASALRTTERGPSGLEHLTKIAGTLESLAQLEGELLTAEKNTADGLEEAERALRQVKEALIQAEVQHGASGRHSVVAQQLDTLAGLLSEKPKWVAAVSGAEADVEKLGSKETSAQERAAAAEADTERRRLVHVDAQTAAQQAARARERAEQAVSSVAAAAGRLSDQADVVAQVSRGLESARADVAEADAGLTPLIEDQAEAQQALQMAIRSESAAAASHGCYPGDDCPVCGRALPESWVAPAAVDLDAAREHSASTNAAVDEATDRQRRAREECVGARTRLRSALDVVADIYEEIANLAAALELPAPPEPSDALRPVDREDDEVLVAATHPALGLPEAVGGWVEKLGGQFGPLQEAEQEAHTRLTEAANELALAETAQSSATNELGNIITELAAAEARRKAAVEALESCEERLMGTLSAVDERWRTLIDLGIPDPLKEARRTLADDETAVATAVKGVQEAQSAVATQERAAHDLVTRRAQDLTAPLTGARTELHNLTEVVNDLCDRVELQGGSAVNTDAGANALHAAATDLITVAHRAVEAAGKRCAELLAKADELAAPATEVVSTLVTLMSDADPEGVVFRTSPDPEDPLSDSTRRLVQQVVGGARQMASEATAQADTAKKAVKTARELDERLAALGTWAADLDGAIDVLKKERFPRWARGLKMADLVESASEHLSEMTDSRYRFGPALQISDEVAGVVRRASTLSGGEKFEASLALALGVSEIAGRSGVRIETLFLDEGFAGLDQAHLNRALDALEQEVEAGRSIVLITHIGAVADRIEDVLLIQPDGAGGSTTKWLDEDERFELGADLDLAVP